MMRFGFKTFGFILSLSMVMVLCGNDFGDVLAQDYGEPGARVFQDNRIPKTQQKRKVILKKKSTPSSSQADKADSRAENGGDDDQVNEDVPNEVYNQQGSPSEPPPRSAEDLKMLQDHDIDSFRGLSSSGNELDRENEALMRISACDQICGKVDPSPRCMNKCKKLGFCELDYIECDGDEVSIDESVLPVDPYQEGLKNQGQ